MSQIVETKPTLVSRGLGAAAILRTYFPGVLVSLIIAVAATFLSEHYGGPVMLFALLLVIVAALSTLAGLYVGVARSLPPLDAAAQLKTAQTTKDERSSEKSHCGLLTRMRRGRSGTRCRPTSRRSLSARRPRPR